MRTVIFTDLDGTLLDSGYSFAAAEKALARIRAEGIPLVLVTSKTRAEVEVIRQRLSNTDPFVVENGGAVFVPPSCFPFPVDGEALGGYALIRLGAPYKELRSALERIREETKAGIRGFGDMTAAEVASVTGLAPEEAELARQREFDEPFIMEGGKGGSEEEARRLVEASGFSFTMGRLYHMTGPSDKGKAVEILISYYRAARGAVTTIGLGNAQNDLPMLALVDYPVMVMGEDGSYAEAPGIPGLIKAAGAGPVGWSMAVEGILDSLRSSREGYTC